MNSTPGENGSGTTKAFPYSEKWKDVFEWADRSTIGEKYTYCRSCDINLLTFHKGLIELKQHVESSKHKKRTPNGRHRQLSEPLPCSDTALQFIRKHCNKGSASGEKVSERFAQHKLGVQHYEDIRSVCQRTPYSVYVYEGVALDKDTSVSVVLVGFFDVEAARHSLRFLDTFQSVNDEEDQTARAVVETLKRFGLSACNLVAFYANGSRAASDQIYSHLRELNPNVVALGWLYTIADTACQTGIKELSIQVQELMADIHAHHSSSTTRKNNLEAVFGPDVRSGSPSFPLNTSCLTFCLLVSELLEVHKSCHKNDDKTKLIHSRHIDLLQEPKVRATFMFLEQALKPLCSFQGFLQTLEGADRANILLILEEASNLLCTYTSYFLRPQASVRFLKEHDVQILKNKKFHLSSPELCLGEKAVEALNESGDTDAMQVMKQEALSFYAVLTQCIAEKLPLNEGLLRSVGQLLSPQGRLKVSGRAVGELGTKLGICSSPEEVSQLTSEFLKYQMSEVEECDEEEKISDVVSLEKHWANVLKDIKPSSLFRKLVLTLLSFPCPSLKPQQIFTEVCK